jgi:hypothetical protein
MTRRASWCVLLRLLRAAACGAPGFSFSKQNLGLREIVWVIRGLSGSSCSAGGVSAAALATREASFEEPI